MTEEHTRTATIQLFGLEWELTGIYTDEGGERSFEVEEISLSDTDLDPGELVGYVGVRRTLTGKYEDIGEVLEELAFEQFRDGC